MGRDGLSCKFISKFEESLCRIDYVKFRQILSDGCHLVGTLIYMGLPDNISRKQKNLKMKVIIHLYIV